MGLEDAQAVAMDARGVVALHDQLYDGGWTTMNTALRSARDRMDSSKQTLSSLPFYAYSKMKRPELVALLQERGIVLPHKGTVETLAWLLVTHHARAGDAKHAAEVSRLTCVHCNSVYFDDEAGRSWICCSQRGCFQWNHVQCERADGEAVKKQKKYSCRHCLDPARRSAASQSSKCVCFLRTMVGPVGIFDEVLSGRAFAPMGHMWLGDAVFFQ